MENKSLQKNFARDLVLMKTVGINPVLIHGGGPQINLELSKIISLFNSKMELERLLEMMNIVQKVLDSKVNKQISDLINIWGGKTTRLVGAKNSPIIAVKDSSKRKRQVGLIKKVDKKKFFLF